MCQLKNLILNYEKTKILTGLDDYKTSHQDYWKIAMNRQNLKDNFPENNTKTDHGPCLNEALHSSVVIGDGAQQWDVC